MTRDPVAEVLGRVINARYRIDRLIGKGGSGSVFEATQLGLDRKVAVKLLHPRMCDGENKRRFVREAKITSQLRHPNAIKVYDFGDFDQRLYLAMELLTGHALRAAIHKRGPGMVLKRALTLALQIADVLHAAHSINLIHRDLKPENVMLDRDSAGKERAVVVDFGLAFIADTEEEGLGRMTTTGMLVGTPAYLSPEQAQGLTIGPSSDIYSFGCLLLEMVTGAPPFHSQSIVGVVNQHLFVEPPSIKSRHPSLEVPPELERLIAQMLSKPPAHRPDAAQVRDTLERLLTAPADSNVARGRGRGERDLGPRGARFDTIPANQGIAITSEFGAMDPGAELTPIALIDYPCDSELAAALATNLLRGINTTWDDLDADIRVVFAPEATVAQIQALSGEGRAVVTASDPGDMDRISALIRAGAADVVPNPPKAQKLARKLQRALRKAKTP